MTQSTNIRQLIVIDSQVTDWQSLVTNIDTDASVLILDSSHDGITQIADAVANYSDLAAIHIISHGGAGSLLLGSSTLTSNNLANYSRQLSSIGNSLSDNGDILLYGCEVAAGATGLQFIEQLGVLTGADIAASTNLTSASALGGDWLLEAQTGAIETKLFLDTAAQTDYAATLAMTVSGSGNGVNSSISDVTFAENYEELGSDLSISSLLGGSQWGDSYGAGINTTYLTTSFSTANSVYSYDDGSTSAMQAFKAVQITAARSAMAGWAAVANIIFTETTDSASNAGDIRWGQTSSASVTTAYAYYPDDAANGGDIWIGPNYSQYYQNPVVGGYGYQTYVHELGHALGLGHPHQGYTTPEPGEDQLKYSIMSYRSYADAPLTGYTTSYYPTTPMLNDILAIQFLYGANTGYHTGNDTYQWTSTQRIYETLWDAGGIDSINASNQAQGVYLNLNAGQWCQIGVAFSNGQANVRDCLTIAYGTIIENAVGSAFNDILTGNNVANSLEGSNGNDTLNGGDGNDLLDGGVGIDILNGGVGDDTYVTDNIGDNVVENVNSGIDTVQSSINYTLIANVDNLMLTGNAVLNGTGNELANTLTGNSNNNLLEGANGNDTLNGGMGNDSLTGGNGADTYLIAMNDGQDEINNLDVDSSVDRVLFTDVASSDVTAILHTIDGFDSLIFKYGAGGQLTVEHFFSDINYQIDQFLLTDVTWGYSDISARTTTVNVNPTASPQTLTTNEDTTYVFAAGNFGFNDVNAGDTLQAIQITRLAGAGALRLNNAAVILNQTIAITDINAGLLTFSPVGNANGNNYASFDFKVSDGTVFSTAAYTLTVNVLPINDPAVISGNTSGNITEDSASNTVTGTLNAADVDNTANLFQAVIEGTASTGSYGTYAVSTAGVWTYTLNNSNVTVNALNTGDTLHDTFTVNSVDGTAQVITISINGVNDNIPPTASNLNTAEIYTEDTLLNLTDIVVTDSNSNTVNVNLTLSNTAAGSLNSATSGAVTSTYNSDTGVWSASGAIVDINALLAALTFMPATNFNGNFTIAISVFDGIAPALIGSKSFTAIAVRDDLTLTGTAGNDTLQGDLIDTGSYDTLSGLAGADILRGYTGNDSLLGGDGNDLLEGNDGDDMLDGGKGIDAMIGGLGNDIYFVDNASDEVTETSIPASGIDTVNSAISYTLGANLENLTLTGISALKGTGNTLNNILIGNIAANTLDGGLGADILIGDLGNDIYTVDDAGDTVIETSLLTTEIDKVNSAISYTLGENVENLTLTGTAEIDGTGNTLNNILTGNIAANMLNGDVGADRMIGGLGNDTYIIDNTGDSAIETSTLATEIDLVNSTISYTLKANIENLNLTGTAVINGTGNTLDNVLTGNIAANTLNGSAGNDTLNGLEGADILIGGLGKDSYTLTESVANTDIVKIIAGDSLTTDFDVVNGFKLGTGGISTDGVDKLDLAKTLIAADATVDGINSGVIFSHSISNGLISFDDADSYTAALAITASNLTDVFNYLINNITKLGNTVAFNAEGNTYVFQDAGINDTLVELTGVTAGSISTTGFTADTVWIA